MVGDRLVLHLREGGGEKQILKYFLDKKIINVDWKVFDYALSKEDGNLYLIVKEGRVFSYLFLPFNSRYTKNNFPKLENKLVEVSGIVEYSVFEGILKSVNIVKGEYEVRVI